MAVAIAHSEEFNAHYYEIKVRVLTREYECSYREAIAFLVKRPTASMMAELLGLQEASYQEAQQVRAFIERTADRLRIPRLSGTIRPRTRV